MPDTAHVHTITTRWVYDRANRVIEEIAPDSQVDSTGRDAAGNAIAFKPRRFGGFADSTKFDSVGMITMQYDALNRLVQRNIPATRYRPIFDNTVTPSWSLPRYTTGYFIPSDVETYAYDPMARVTSAVNSNALVSRTYNLDGTLASDTLRIRAYSSTDSSQHVYGLGYRYDLDGRRTSLLHPDALAPIVSGTRKDVQTYSYDSVTGALSAVSDVLGNTFLYAYDAKGRLDSLVSPGGVREDLRYDDDDNLILRVDSATQFVGQAGGFPLPHIHRDTLIYDARGKVIEARTLLDTAHFGYSALGALADGATIPDTASTFDGLEEFTVNDALGNRVWNWQDIMHNGVETDSAQTLHHWFSHAGTAREDSVLGVMAPNETRILYDRAGDVWVSGTSRPTTLITHVSSFSYYDALGRLRMLDKRSCNTQSSNPPYVCDFHVELDASDKGYFEEYRYDALGRRVLLRSRSDSTCPQSGNGCVSVIQRSVYDGDQVLYELQMPGADSIAPSLLERDTNSVYQDFLPYGRLAYTHGIGLDQPLDVIRMAYDSLWPAPEAVIPHADWRGVDDVGSFDDGREKRCTNYNPGGQSTCVQVSWPQPFYGLFSEDYNHDLNLPVAWFGSLVNMRRDASGHIYLRNRYYDPDAARFTQEDPLGLAGGINAYGFAAGDPVNFSDPFGLTCLIRGNCTQSDGGLVELHNEREISGLHKSIQGAVRRLIENANENGRTAYITEGFRSNAEQARDRARGSNVTEKGPGESFHNYGLAVDIYPAKNGGPDFSGSGQQQLGVTGEAIGFRWGGRWKIPYDPPHFEMTGGLTIADLKALVAQGRWSPVPH